MFGDLMANIPAALEQVDNVATTLVRIAEALERLANAAEQDLAMKGQALYLDSTGDTETVEITPPIVRHQQYQPDPYAQGVDVTPLIDPGDHKAYPGAETQG